MHWDQEGLFLRGEGAPTDGARPFPDRLNLKSRKSDRLFRSDKPALEYFVSFTDATNHTFMTWHQSPTEPPNAMLRTLGDAIAGAKAGEATIASTTRAITHIPDPTPVARSIKKRLVKYKRKDGVELSFTLYTPP